MTAYVYVGLPVWFWATYIRVNIFASFCVLFVHRPMYALFSFSNILRVFRLKVQRAIVGLCMPCLVFFKHFTRVQINENPNSHSLQNYVKSFGKFLTALNDDCVRYLLLVDH